MGEEYFTYQVFTQEDSAAKADDEIFETAKGLVVERDDYTVTSNTAVAFRIFRLDKLTEETAQMYFAIPVEKALLLKNEILN
jgi:hypothetical protein